MEIAGMVLCAAQTLFAALQCSEVKQVCSILGCKSQLNDLSGTVVRIKAALEDAEAKQELSKQDRLFIEELKDAVYDADDLFDEFVTLAERKKLSKGIKVRVLALFGKYGTAYKMAQGVKMIKKKLDAIASDTRFNFNIDPKPIRNRRLESCSYVSNKELFSGLEDLKALRNLSGYLEINIPFMNTGANAGKKNGGREGDCLGNKIHLKDIHLKFSGKGRAEYDEAVMGELQPHPNLERFRVYCYRGVRMSGWPMEDNLATFLPNLVHMVFWCCPLLQYSGQLRLPLLKTLSVRDCPNLIAIMQCPALEDLTLLDFNKRLEVIPTRRIRSKEFEEATPSGIRASSSSYSYDVGLKVRIDNMGWLNSLPMNSFLGLATLVISRDREVESMGGAREVFRSCSSSLISLKFEGCSKLKSVVFGGLEHLTALEKLKITKCSNLSLLEEVEREDGMPWKPFHHPLRSLYLVSLPQLVQLPNWIQYLTSLETLQIWDCKGLESVPNWMSKLTSLKVLQLGCCSERLIERCQQSIGENWPHIQHIPEIEIYNH
ncbi:hypothetical protein SOVF_076790 [Spinacia oleracea]|nr:hypothetical protein SOVF_076790 [Spinacia oleracea]